MAKLTFAGWHQVQGHGLWQPLPFFYIGEEDGKTHFSFHVQIPWFLGDQLVRTLHSEEAAKEAVLLFCIETLEDGIASGAYRLDQQNTGLSLVLKDEDDVQRIVGAPSRMTKQCGYQEEVGRDLYCNAATVNDPTVAGRTAFRQLAATTLPICSKCELPDSRIICRHLHHPSVMGGAEEGRLVRHLIDAMCDLGRDEIDDNGGWRCRPGANGCWSRSVGFVHPTVATLPPGNLAEALAWVDFAWREVFGAHLLKRPGLTETVQLAMSAETREDFVSRIGALDDTLRRLEIADDLIEANEKPPKDASLKRLDAALSSRADDSAGLSQAVNTLRSVNWTRVAFIHSGRSTEIPAALGSLGIAYPVTDWSGAWDTVRAQATIALEVLGRILRTHAEHDGAD